MGPRSLLLNAFSPPTDADCRRGAARAVHTPKVKIWLGLHRSTIPPGWSGVRKLFYVPLYFRPKHCSRLESVSPFVVLRLRREGSTE
jgi:hypothetical protein